MAETAIKAGFALEVGAAVAAALPGEPWYYAPVCLVLGLAYLFAGVFA